MFLCSNARTLRNPSESRAVRCTILPTTEQTGRKEKRTDNDNRTTRSRKYIYGRTEDEDRVYGTRVEPYNILRQTKRTATDRGKRLSRRDSASGNR